jgi:hypothetical protein
MSDTSQRIHRKESVVLRGFLYAVQFISLGCLLGKKGIEQGNAGRYNERTTEHTFWTCPQPPSLTPSIYRGKIGTKTELFFFTSQYDL